MRLRPATIEDAEQIRAIYNLEVETSTATFDLVPRSVEDQRAWLLDRSGAFTVIVAEEAEEVIGYAAISPYKERAAYRTTVENGVYVRRDQQGKGVGRALLSEMVRVAKANGFHTIIARIERGNESSIALHRACGYEIIGNEREVGRKFGRWLDCTVMQRMLG